MQTIAFRKPVIAVLRHAGAVVAPDRIARVLRVEWADGMVSFWARPAGRNNGIQCTAMLTSGAWLIEFEEDR